MELEPHSAEPDRLYDIKSTVEASESCQQLLPSQQQELYICDDHPKQPFESVSADFFFFFRLQVAGHCQQTP